jgi:hypothetical protein
MKQKTFTKDKTAFKLCVYYSHRSNGTAYNIAEITRKDHRKYHDSIDYINTANGWLTRHDLAYQKLINHLKKHRDKIFSALLYCNNHKAGKQYLIAKFNRNVEFDEQVIPQFFKNTDGSIQVNGLNQAPLETYEL